MKIWYYGFLLFVVIFSSPLSFAMQEETQQTTQKKLSLGQVCGMLSNKSDAKFEKVQRDFDQAVQHLNQMLDLKVGEERKEITLKEESLYGYLYMVESEFSFYKKKIDVLIGAAQTTYFQFLLDMCEKRHTKKELRLKLVTIYNDIIDEINNIKVAFVNTETQRNLSEKDLTMTRDPLIISRVSLLRSQYINIFQRYLRILMETQNSMNTIIKRQFKLI